MNAIESLPLTINHKTQMYIKSGFSTCAPKTIQCKVSRESSCFPLTLEVTKNCPR